MSAQTIGILVFDKIEVLDFVGPYEVFIAVRLDESKRWETKPPFDVYLVAEKIEPVASHNGMQRRTGIRSAAGRELPAYQGRNNATRGRRRQCDYLGRDFGGHRPRAETGCALLRR